MKDFESINEPFKIDTDNNLAVNSRTEVEEANMQVAAEPTHFIVPEPLVGTNEDRDIEEHADGECGGENEVECEMRKKDKLKNRLQHLKGKVKVISIFLSPVDLVSSTWRIWN